MAPKKCKTENSQKRKNFVGANTIMARVSTILLLGDGQPLTQWLKKVEDGHRMFMGLIIL